MASVSSSSWMLQSEGCGVSAGAPPCQPPAVGSSEQSWGVRDLMGCRAIGGNRNDTWQAPDKQARKEPAASTGRGHVAPAKHPSAPFPDLAPGPTEKLGR